jgi:predicted RNase H-related nuclease YkuK (DUF458 family)
MKNKIVKEWRASPPNSKMYLGADSTRFMKGGQAWARISVVAVIHLASSKGCKVIGHEVIERVYDTKLGKPQHRMMLEVYEVAKLYAEVIQEIPDADIEVHLDISTNAEHGSSCAAKQAAGYILGMCNVVPIMKPNAWAASTCADLFTKKLG